MVIVRPREATHAVLTTSDGKKSMVGVDDLDCLAGISGTITWLKLGRNYRERIGSKLKVDGNIEEITSDYQKRKRDRK